MNKLLLGGMGVVLSVGLLFGLWHYISSFQNVTFEFDESWGYVEIIGADEQPLYPGNNQLVKLKKSEYRIKNVGDDIQIDERMLTVDDHTSRIPVYFSYTDEYLGKLYSEEKKPIESTLLAKYPRLPELYTVQHGTLYGHGDIYGAILVAKDTKGDNSDTLRILMQKEGDEWSVLSMPPTPILSAPLYPDINPDILRKINQAK